MGAPATALAANQLPAKFLHEMGNWKLRLQCFVTVRDAQRRIALVRLQDVEGWCIPGETMLFNETPDDAARRVARSWFTVPVGMALDRILSFPATSAEDNAWYLVFVYDAEVRGELKGTPDTLEIRWVDAGEAPGPFAFAQGEVWQALT